MRGQDDLLPARQVVQVRVAPVVMLLVVLVEVEVLQEVVGRMLLLLLLLQAGDAEVVGGARQAVGGVAVAAPLRADKRRLHHSRRKLALFNF